MVSQRRHAHDSCPTLASMYRWGVTCMPECAAPIPSCLHAHPLGEYMHMTMSMTMSMSMSMSMSMCMCATRHRTVVEHQVMGRKYDPSHDPIPSLIPAPFSNPATKALMPCGGHGSQTRKNGGGWLTNLAFEREEGEDGGKRLRGLGNRSHSTARWPRGFSPAQPPPVGWGFWAARRSKEGCVLSGTQTLPRFPCLLRSALCSASPSRQRPAFVSLCAFL